MPTVTDGGERPSRRAWGSLSQEEVVSAALAIAREEGLAALSIRRLATELSASRMSVYHYVPDKESLLDLVANAIAERDMPIPEHEGPWDEGLRALARTMRRHMLNYPGLAELLVMRGNYRPGGLNVIEHVLGLLAEAGIEGTDAARYYIAFSDMVWGRVLRELQAGVTDPSRIDRAEATLSTLPEDRFGRLRHAIPDLRIDDETLFETELDLFIQGVRHVAEHG
jgi:AcrR family transcriptional regulator